MDSYILNFLEDHDISELKSYNINFKEENGLTIFNYGVAGPDFTNPLVREARGIIIDIPNRKVVCWPFTKFGNYFESYADNIDWESATVQEKIDGSIVKLYYYNGQWNWATNKCIDAANAVSNQCVQKTSFLEIIQSAANYFDIDYNLLNENYTYIFELVSPQNQVVIKYDKPYLYHLGTRSNINGQEYNVNIGIEQPRVYRFDCKNLESVIIEAEELNADNAVEHEGFVVCDKDFHRIKVKNPQYLELHYALTNNINSNAKIVEAIINNDEEFIAALQQHDIAAQKYEVLKNAADQLIADVNEYISYVRSLGLRRNIIASIIKDDKFAFIGFKSLDYSDYGGIDILRKYNIKVILNLLQDYLS